MFPSQVTGTGKLDLKLDGRINVSCWGAYRYLKQIQDLPSTGLPKMNLLEKYSLKDEMGSLR